MSKNEIDRPILLTRAETPNQHAVVLEILADDTYRITYGKDVRLAANVYTAYREFYRAVRHAIACNGWFDDD